MTNHAQAVPRPSQQVTLTIFFGGPSNERNISLDSARTLYDSVRKKLAETNITLVFISRDTQFFRLDPKWIYSNTIEDFEHLPHQPLQADALNRLIKESDVLCPIVHGAYGEDGQLSARFEAQGRQAYLGSPPAGLATTLNKQQTVAAIAERGFPTVPNALITAAAWAEDAARERERAWHQVPGDTLNQRIVKPNRAGSSDGVSLSGVDTFDEAVTRALAFGDEVLVEQRIEGREFSLIVLQDQDDSIVPLAPTGIAIAESDTDPNQDNLYTRNKKYMPGAGARHQTPLAGPAELLQRMRTQAVDLFQALGLRDWARFDGFLSDDGTIIWSDLNGIPGCGLDSFLFQQAALFGMRHADVFSLLITRAAAREGRRLDFSDALGEDPASRRRVAVIGGGATSERHVSRMSWFNVTQKLAALQQYRIHTIYLDAEEAFWEVPAFVALQHTVDEIEAVLADVDAYQRAVPLVQTWRGTHFAGYAGDVAAHNFAPRRLKLADFPARFDFVFLALHGGIGENGTMQRRLDQLGLPYNGSSSQVAGLCMDKQATNQKCREFAIPGFEAPGQHLVARNDLIVELSRYADLDAADLETLTQRLPELIAAEQRVTDPLFQRWAKAVVRWAAGLQATLQSDQGLVLKPKADGCSSGVLVSRQPEHQLPIFLLFMMAGRDRIPQYLLYPKVTDRELFIALPRFDEILVEQMLAGADPETFMEMTIGVIGTRGKITAFYPSETLAQTDVLSLDEKFNKGMGVNLTPPPALDAAAVASIRARLAAYADQLGIEGYARIDVMYRPDSDTLYLIEVNNLPGLTSATIIYTQALVTPEFALKPAEFLDELIQLGFARQA
ncbi:hypothetical protein [Acanthopleuribacter pedis]|uniref:D-alanine--D-alanine ligase n=1 Tax=Acanthopleuribacter pedis TaxID=442870 RepID=A0A8J7Q7D0_9BACT|nr:hypothetical protein [Acanthopleuribacter pedis]